MTSPTVSVRTWTRNPLGGSLRLTARGRMVLCSLLACALVGVSALAIVGPAARARTAPPAVDTVLSGPQLALQGLAQVHVVVAGDTLWELATGLDPHGDPRPLIDEIQELNGLHGSRLSVGQQLWLPVPGSESG